MGLFNKLKNALFEEEEIDFESAAPEKEEIKKEEPVKEIKKEEPKKEKLSFENERDLFKAENTFNFPDFDEEEFVTNYEPPKKEEVKPPKKVETRKPKIENLYNEPKVKVTQEKPSSKRRREKNVVKEEPVKKSFHPSPIISPVYGVLDKNYKKEDIIPSDKLPKQARINDVDIIRKKAFGSLEEDIEKTLNEPMEGFYNDSKSIDELLSESIDDTIEINHPSLEDTFEMRYEPKEKTKIQKKRNETINRVEEELETQEDNLRVIDEELPKNSDCEENSNLEDTLENDLFDLIDSMYDDREEE